MLGAFIWKRNERMIRNVPARRPLTSVWVYEWQVSGRRQLRVPITIFFDCFLNSREVWFGESHHQMLLGGLKNVQNDEVYQIFAWVNLGWHQRRKEKKRGCCSDSSERRIWLVVEACVPASHADLQASCNASLSLKLILCAYSMRKRIWNLMVKQSRSDSCNLPPKPFQTCLTRDFWSRAELWHCFRKGGWGKGGASSWWMSVQTSLSQPPKNCLSPIRSGHKDERINRRKLTSDLVQLEFCF